MENLVDCLPREWKFFHRLLLAVALNLKKFVSSPSKD